MKEHLKNDNLTKFGMPASGGFFNLVASISSWSFHGCLSLRRRQSTTGISRF